MRICAQGTSTLRHGQACKRLPEPCLASKCELVCQCVDYLIAPGLLAEQLNAWFQETKAVWLKLYDLISEDRTIAASACTALINAPERFWFSGCASASTFLLGPHGTGKL